MQILVYRALYLSISSNVHLSKSISILAKVSQISYQDRNYREKKIKCWACNCVFQHVFMLIVHLEMIHYGCVQKYDVRNECLFIAIKAKSDNEKYQKVIAQGYLLNLNRSNDGVSLKCNNGNQIGMNCNTSVYLTSKFQTRVKTLINSIIQKIQKPSTTKERIYFHSTNIFKRIDPHAIDEDSEEDIGQVERELEKLRIQDFSDVNHNDKKFFIQWNGFIHDYKKRMFIIYSHDMPQIFVEFSGLAPQKGIPRINLVMHAWTLWSVGQINSNDITSGLNKYDQCSERVASFADTSELYLNNGSAKVSNNILHE